MKNCNQARFYLRIDREDKVTYTSTGAIRYCRDCNSIHSKTIASFRSYSGPGVE